MTPAINYRHNRYQAAHTSGIRGERWAPKSVVLSAHGVWDWSRRPQSRASCLLIVSGSYLVGARFLLKQLLDGGKIGCLNRHSKGVVRWRF